MTYRTDLWYELLTVMYDTTPDAPKSAAAVSLLLVHRVGVSTTHKIGTYMRNLVKAGHLVCAEKVRGASTYYITDAGKEIIAPFLDERKALIKRAIAEFQTADAPKTSGSRKLAQLRSNAEREQLQADRQQFVAYVNQRQIGSFDWACRILGVPEVIGEETVNEEHTTMELGAM